MTPLASRFVYPMAALLLFSASGCFEAHGDETLTETAGARTSMAENTQGNNGTRANCEMNETEQEMLKRVNDARGQARQCGSKQFKAASPLSWNCKLEAAAAAHGRDMAAHNFFSHIGSGGTRIGDRVKAQGYRWMAVGENIAAGQRSVAAVIDGWLASPGHCANIMSDTFTEMGMIQIDEPSARYSPYWTQVFAKPR